MPPSRLDATLGLLSAPLLVTLTLSVFLSFFSILDTRAGGPPRHLTLPLFDMEALEKLRMEDFKHHGGVGTRSSLSSQHDPTGMSLSPFPFAVPFDDAGFLGLSPDDPPGNGISGDTPERTPGDLKLSPSLTKDQVWSVAKRKIPEAASSLFGNLVLFKPTLAGGAIYRKGGEGRDSRFTMDLLVPARLNRSAALFFESRAEYQDLFSHIVRSAAPRFDLGLGLGFRKVWHEDVMVGTNVFWDTSRLYEDWYSSPGFGVEFAWDSHYGFWDLTLNVYRGGGIDLKTGFTFPILDDHLDMRIHAEKYRFFDGEFILGSKGGVEISTPGRLLAVSYEIGQDSRNPVYQAIGCSLTVPFRLENLFSCKNPFELPVRRGRPTRYTERLGSQGVKRAWRHPDTVVEARNTPQGERWTTPGRLSDSIFWSKKPKKQNEKAAKPESRTCGKPKECTCKQTDKTHTDDAPGCSLLEALLGTKTGSAIIGTICALGATYVSGDYVYRNAFGPFELEPYERDLISKEMPKRRRLK